MSDNNATWYCHECHAETVPVLMPNPRCAQCHSDFVERLDPSTSDDPRTPPEAIAGAPPSPGGGVGGGGIGGLVNLLTGGLGRMGLGGEGVPGSGGGGGSPPQVRETTPAEWARTFRFGNGTIRIGGSRGGGSGMPGDFLFPLPPSPHTRPYPRSPSSGTPPPLHTHPLAPGAMPDFLQQYILSLLASSSGATSPPGMGGMGMGMHGRAGDYVFSQDALDALMTQLMEGAPGAHHTQPASREALASLPRSRVTGRSELIQRECAVCKDGFEVGQETTALPCSHSFHNDCILPWLEINGTCPVCRTPVSGDSSAPTGMNDSSGGGGGPPHSPHPNGGPSPGSSHTMPGTLHDEDYIPWESLD